MLVGYSFINKIDLFNIGSKLLKLNYSAKSNGLCTCYKIFLEERLLCISND